MDILFIIVAIISIVIIVIVYILNYIPKTYNVTKLFERISKNKPSTQAFSLGRRNETSKFRNVVLNKDGKAIVVDNEDYPIGFDGRYIVLKDHGTVVENENGFKITGMDLVDFKCPEGYEGSKCQPKPLCLPEDSGKVKPLTYTQFNSLRLYRNEFKRDQIQMPYNSLDDEPIHPRLRIQCLDIDGNYDIEACPQNRLLDKNLQCQPYDICSDRLNGFKHNFPIQPDEHALPSNEYYICDNNVSVKRKCNDGTVFSFNSKGCVTKSPCYNMGQATIPIDDASYIQCENDIGFIVECPSGVVNNDGILACYTPLCMPETKTYENKHLRYDYSQTICIDDRPQITTCDVAAKDRVYHYTWAEDFDYILPNWPKEILKNGQCISPDDSIIYDPFVSLAWSTAMPERHKFNIKTQQYECDDSTQYRWNYIDQKLMPENNNIDELIYSGAPCQNAIESQLKFKIQNFPNNKIYLIKTQPVHLFDYTNVYLWPVYNRTNDNYLHTRCEYTDSGLEITTYSSNTIPLGFYLDDTKHMDSNNNTLLTLSGYSNFEQIPNVQYYFIASGKLDLIILHEPTIEAQQKYTFPQNNTISTKIETETIFCINMNEFKNRVEISEVNNTNSSKIIFDPNTLTMTQGNNTYNLGFSLFRLRNPSIDSDTNFTFEDIDVNFNNNQLSDLQF